MGDRACRWGLVLSLACLPLLGLAVGDGGPFQPPIMVAPETTFLPDSSAQPHVNKALAAGLTVLLGPLGAHRIYLGTRPRIPIFYAVTFGGFGVLALIDLGHILFTKDLDRFRENDRMLMWTRPHGARAITPP